MTPEEQIGKLSDFIMTEVSSEFSQKENTIDAAIRIIRKQNEKLEEVWNHIRRI